MLCKECKQDRKLSAICEGCKEFKPIKAKGLCQKCYARFQRHGDTSWERKKKGDMLCSFCHEKPIHAKGFCDNCYARYLKTGSPEKIEIEKFRICKYCGKMKKHKAKGYCSTCYARVLRHGDGNPNIVKKKQIKACKNCKKVTTIKARGYCATCYQRWKKTGSAKYTKIVHICKVDGCEKPVASHGYCDTHRDRFIDKRKAANRTLIKRFGITVGDYEGMYERQGGVCAICGQPETIKANGNVINLAIDHCHKSSQVRGLLCSLCNTALGGFKDSTELLTKAINYLNKTK